MTHFVIHIYAVLYLLSYNLFPGISSLSYGFEALNKVPGGMKSISKHTFSLAKYAVAQMCGLEHFNGGPAVKIYCEEDSYYNELNYGGIVNFNLLSSDGAYVGFSSLNLLCQMNNIILRYQNIFPSLYDILPPPTF